MVIVPTQFLKPHPKPFPPARLSYGSNFQGIDLGSRIYGRSETFPPIADHLAAKHVQYSFAKLHPLERVSKNIPVADISIHSKGLFPFDYCLRFFKRKMGCMKKGNDGKSVFAILQNHDFVENHSGSKAVVYRDFWQTFAAKAKRPIFQKSRGLTVVFDDNFQSRMLEKDFRINRCRISIPQFVDNEMGNGYATGNIRTSFSGFRGEDSCHGLRMDFSKSAEREKTSPASQSSERPVWYVCRGVKFMPLVRLSIVMFCVWGGTWLYLCESRSENWAYLAAFGLLLGVAPIPWDLGFRHGVKPHEQPEYRQIFLHDSEIVLQKNLTRTILL
jgi:hypothetical protein